MRSHLACLLVVLAASAAHAGKGVQVSLGAVGGTGATDTYRAAVTAKVQRTYLSGIKSCYRSALRKRPGLTGKLAIGFTVDKRGVATQVQTGLDKALDPCVLKAVKGWKFGVPKDDAKATVDATFTLELTLIETDEYAAEYAVALQAEGDPAEGQLSNRRPGADLGAQIDAVKEGSKNVRVGGAAGAGVRADGQGPLRTDSPGSGVPSGPSGRITISGKQAFDESTLTVDAVQRKIQAAYFAGLKRCYKTRLNADATLRGKVKLDFTVNEAGRTIGGKARGFDPDLDTCMTTMLGNWMFPIPKDRDGEATDAAFSLTLTLVPD